MRILFVIIVGSPSVQFVKRAVCRFAHATVNGDAQMSNEPAAPEPRAGRLEKLADGLALLFCDGLLIAAWWLVKAGLDWLMANVGNPQGGGAVVVLFKDVSSYILLVILILHLLPDVIHSFAEIMHAFTRHRDQLK